MERVLDFLAWGFGFQKGSSSSDAEPPESSEQTLLREQLEYYFSDANVERDEQFRSEIAKSEERFVSVEYILACNRVKQLAATANDILTAAAESRFLEADFDGRRVRSTTVFVSDPRRSFRTIRVAGFATDIPQSVQTEFFESIFPGKVRYVNLLRAGESLDYTGVSIVELDNEEIADAAAQRGIEYGDGVLAVEVVGKIARGVEADRARPQRAPKKSKARK
jgi:lupus La protein